MLNTLLLSPPYISKSHKNGNKVKLNSIHLAFIHSFNRLNAWHVQVMVCSIIDKIKQCRSCSQEANGNLMYDN